MKIVRGICIVALIIAHLPCYAAAECTRDQAFNKMMKMNQLNAKLQTEVPLDPRQDPNGSNRAYLRIKEYSDRMAPAGQLLASGKYTEACKIYDQTAAYFNFDLGTTKALTVEQLKKDGGKSVSGTCSVSDVAQRSVQLMQSFQQAYDAGKFSYEKQREFSKDSEAMNRYANSDPGRACRELARLKDKYGL